MLYLGRSLKLEYEPPCAMSKSIGVKLAYLFHWTVLGQCIVILAEKTWAGPFAPNAIVALLAAQILMLISTGYFDKYARNNDPKHAFKSWILQAFATSCVPIALVLAKDSIDNHWTRPYFVFALLLVCAGLRAYLGIDVGESESKHWLSFANDPAKTTICYVGVQAIEIVLVFYDHTITKATTTGHTPIKSVDDTTLLVDDMEMTPNSDGTLPDEYKYLWPIVIVYVAFSAMACVIIAVTEGQKRFSPVSTSVWVVSAIALVMVYTNYNKRQVEEGTSVLAVVGAGLVIFLALHKNGAVDGSDEFKLGSSFADVKRARYHQIISGL